MFRIVGGTDHDEEIGADAQERSANAHKLIEHAHQIASLLEGDVASFFIIGIKKDGSHSTGWRLDPDSLFMGETLFGAFITEIVRREIITQSEVVNILNRDTDTSDDGA